MRSFKEFMNTDAGLSSLASMASKNQNPVPIMPVSSAQIDARISVQGLEKAYTGMQRAINLILSDESATVQSISDEGQDEQIKPWGAVYFLSNKNSPERGVIEIEYAPQATKNIVGDIGYTANWMSQNWKRPFRLAGEKMGLMRNPEKFYLSQFKRELDRLANQRILQGLEEWDIDTSNFGRNIILRPKTS